MRWKKNKWKVLLPVLTAALLAAAFWYGGGAPGTRGWVGGSAQAADPLPSRQPAETAAGAGEALTVLQPSPTDLIPEAAATPEETAPTESTASPNEAGPVETGSAPAPSAPPEGENTPPLDTPLPSENPQPVEPQDAVVSETEYTCTLSISCQTILDHMDWLDAAKAELVPEDGWILAPTSVTFYEGESVFNVLQRTCKQQKIHLEFENTPMYNSAYIEGMHNLYEFDCGELSGWKYKVNDWFPNYGSSRYQLQDGDVICWEYTCELGADLSGT